MKARESEKSSVSSVSGRRADLWRSVSLPGPHAWLRGDDRAVTPTHAEGRGAAQAAARHPPRNFPPFLLTL